MEPNTTLTGQQAIERIYAHIARDDDEGALRFWDEHGRELLPRITAGEMAVIGDLLTSCERALGIDYREIARRFAHSGARE